MKIDTIGGLTRASADVGSSGGAADRRRAKR